MKKLAIGLAALPALLFILSGLNWLFNPASAAETLGMPLLDGMGGSSQIGDLGAFFMAGGLMIVLGIVTRNGVWFYAPALTVGLAAFYRIIAGLAHGVDLVAPAIGLEVVITVILVFAAKQLGGEKDYQES